jgi:hypothetical protein
MTVRHLVVAALALALPTAASAGAWSKNCQFTGGTLVGTVGTPQNANKQIAPGDLGCWRFVVGDSTHNSGYVHVTAETAVITFDPQLDAAVAAATTALVIPHYCATGEPLTAANPERSCVSIGGANGNASLDGVEGAASTQNAAIRVGPGVYYFEVPGACLAGDTCQVSVKGEGVGQ